MAEELTNIEQEGVKNVSNSTDDFLTIQKELLQPFDPHLVEFRPGNVVGEDRANPLAYVPWLEYVKRLDEICAGGWQFGNVQISEGASRVRVSLVLVLRSGWHEYQFPGVGDADQAKDNGTAGAFDQALKRACALAGLGRYLYDGRLGLQPYGNKKLLVPNLVLAVQLYEQLGYHIPEEIYQEIDRLPKVEQRSYSAGSNNMADMKGILEKKIGQLRDFNKVPDEILKHLSLEQASAMQKRFMSKTESKDEILADYFKSPSTPSGGYRRPWQQ